MAIKTLYYSTTAKLSCCAPAAVILCVSKSLVIDSHTTVNNVVGFVTGTLQGQQNLQNQCFGNYTQYIINYNSDQLVDGAVLSDSSVTGIFCADCLTQYMIYLASTGGVVPPEPPDPPLVVPYYSDMCDGTTTAAADLTELLTFTFPEDYFLDCGERIQFTITGTYAREGEAIDPTGSVFLTFGGEEVYEFVILAPVAEVTETGTWMIQGYISRAADQGGGECFGVNLYTEYYGDADAVIRPGRYIGSLMITPTPTLYDFTVEAQVLNEDSSITLGQVVVDYYDIPTICGTNECCGD